MDGTPPSSIIHKKARVAREDFDARAMSPAKALRVSLARMADEQLDLALVVSTLEQTRVSTADLLTQLDGQGMLLLLDGAGGANGVACLDRALVTGVIEQQISGRVRAGVAPERMYTRTDAAMVAPLLDATLQGFDTLLAEHVASYQPAAFRFGDRVEDTRALSLALDGGPFDVFRLTLDVAKGAKTGVLVLALPHRSKPPNPSASPDAAAGDRTVSLKKTAMDAPVPLSAVVARLRLPLNVVCDLQAGMVLPLPNGALSQSELVAPQNHRVADVRLGQVNGMRALRVVLPDDAGPSAAASHPAPEDTGAPGMQMPDAADLDDLPLTPEVLPDLPELDATSMDLPDIPPALAQTDIEADEDGFDLPLPLSLDALPEPL